MKLLTLNCHSWQEENQIEKIKYLAKVIKEKQYDVVALQEISQRIDSKLVNDKVKEDNYVYLLLKELEALGEKNYRFIWDYSHIGYDIYEEGSAILTNKNIVMEESFYVSNNISKKDYRSRKIVKARIKVDEIDYDIYTCHLGWWDDEKEPFKYQLDNLFKHLTNKTSFIMGDFNNDAFIRNQGYDYLIDKGLVDTYTLANNKDSGITVAGEIDGWKGSKNSKRLDLILTNKTENEIIYSKVIFNGENKEIVSDHYGVEIEVQC